MGQIVPSATISSLQLAQPIDVEDAPEWEWLDEPWEGNNSARWIDDFTTADHDEAEALRLAIIEAITGPAGSKPDGQAEVPALTFSDEASQQALKVCEDQKM